MDEIAGIARGQIAGRIAELEREREAFVAQANQQVAAYNAGIGELRRLLAPVAAPSEETGSVSPNGARPIEEKTEV